MLTQETLDSLHDTEALYVVLRSGVGRTGVDVVGPFTRPMALKLVEGHPRRQIVPLWPIDTLG